VIFGASGDLTRRLLLPALYNLAHEQLLDPDFMIVGVDHVERSDEEFRSYIREAMRSFMREQDGEFDAATLEAASWDWLVERLGYVVGDFDRTETYRRLKERLAKRTGETGAGNIVFYMATPPRFFGPIVEQLAEAGLTRETGPGFRRVIVEKPFGMDLASAQALNARILAVIDERQLYRIDHFLGKETVQNIMVLRFANGIFEPIWNRDHIDHVQITAAEAVGVEQRGRFYDGTGALRDMVPNHMLQLLAMVAMEAPNSFHADAIRAEKAKVVDAVRQWSAAEAAENGVRGQYDAGSVHGLAVQSYRREPHVAANSTTETYVALKLMIDNWRWADVPFYVRTGKAMATRCTEIAIQFRRAPVVLFRDAPTSHMTPNFMVLRIQPNEGVSLRFATKVPGHSVALTDVTMDFNYADYFAAEPWTGYETLIYDCLIGDSTLFQRADNIEAGWAAVQPFLDAWTNGADLHLYQAGSMGPDAADRLLARDGRAWLAFT
jgi:glucose-6-phosphate 1-dehydrogenase